MSKWCNLLDFTPNICCMFILESSKNIIRFSILGMLGGLSQGLGGFKASYPRVSYSQPLAFRRKDVFITEVFALWNP